MFWPIYRGHTGQLGPHARFWLLAVLVHTVASMPTAAEELIKGISYGPNPCLQRGELCIQQDDFMAPAAKPFWGSRFRGDLQVMKALGANHVRLYGNNPANSHRNFLDEANVLSMKAIVGMSDYPYTQSPDSCMATTNYDCYSQIKVQYAMNLKNGFMLEDGSYHPALGHVIVINEPDLKLPGISSPLFWCKGIVSAVDGMLDAEKEAGVKGPLVNFTATFSYAICDSCLNAEKNFNGGPAPGLGQMEELRAAFLNPISVGYVARNDLAAVYHSRFTNSFNTANPADDIKGKFLFFYEQLFHKVPVMIGEYHSPNKGTKQEEDLKAILNIASESVLFRGISFFEYQVRYDKGGTEEAFGMFGLSNKFSFGTFDYFGDKVPSLCLVPQKDALGELLPSAVAAAYGGSGLSYSTLCVADPAKVGLDQTGFQQVAAQGSNERMAAFMGRLVNHLGGHVQEQSDLVSFSKHFVGSSETFSTVAQELMQTQPSWALWDKQATCVADREALLQQVHEKFDWVCGNMKFDCQKIPQECKRDSWTMADYAFSMYWIEKLEMPLQNCYFDGAAAYVSTLTTFAANSGCHISRNPLISALTEEGYKEVLNNNESQQTAIFLQRFVRSQLEVDIIDFEALEYFAEAPPATLAAAELALKEKPFVCGLEGHNPCPTTTTTTGPPTTTVATARATTFGPVKPPVHNWHDNLSHRQAAASNGGGPAAWKIAVVVVVAAVVIGVASLAAVAAMNSKAKKIKADAKARKARARPSGANDQLRDVEIDALSHAPLVGQQLGQQPFEFLIPVAAQPTPLATPLHTQHPALQQAAFAQPPLSPPPDQTLTRSGQQLGHVPPAQLGEQIPTFDGAPSFGRRASGSLPQPPPLTISIVGPPPAAASASAPAPASVSPAASLLAYPDQRRGGGRTPGASSGRGTPGGSRTPGSRTPGMRTPGSRTPGSRTPGMHVGRARQLGVRHADEFPVREAPPPLPALAGGALRSAQTVVASTNGPPGFGTGTAPGFGAGPAPGFGAGVVP